MRFERGPGSPFRQAQGLHRPYLTAPGLLLIAVRFPAISRPFSGHWDFHQTAKATGATLRLLHPILQAAISPHSCLCVSYLGLPNDFIELFASTENSASVTALLTAIPNDVLGPC